MDGIKRTKEEEKRLAQTVAATFATPGGQETLAYLKKITIQRVMPNSATSNALWHFEGQRHLVALIQHWIDNGKPGREHKT